MWQLLVEPRLSSPRGAWWRALLALAPCGLFYITVLSVYALFYEQFYAEQSVVILVPSDEFLSLWGPMLSGVVAYYLGLSFVNFFVAVRVLDYSAKNNAVVLLLVGVVCFLQLYMAGKIKEVTVHKIASGDYVECSYKTSQKFDAKAYSSILVAGHSFNGCPESWPSSIDFRF